MPTFYPLSDPLDHFSPVPLCKALFTCFAELFVVMFNLVLKCPYFQ